MNKQVKQQSPSGSYVRNKVGTGAEVRPAIASGIVTGDVPVSYWPIFLLPVSSNSSQKSLRRLTRSSLPPVSLVANGSHVTCQRSLSTVPYFLLEPGVKSRKNN